MHVSSVKMANMYDNTLPTCSSYSQAPEPADDISVLLRQILFKSSSSSSSSPAVAAERVQCEIQRQQPLHLSGVSIPDPIIPIPTLSSPAGANFPATYVARVSSSSVGTIDYEADEYECESEDGFENLMEEMVTKRKPTGNPSKRTRAAEVHNLSEKRRRSRINEKMKALQKLIPNSNKTDKASMLDEAIEYLKQLQLQVQMLTMRNGINLYSVCLPPGLVQPNTKTGGLNEGNGLANMTSNQETLVNPILSQNQTSMLDFSRTINHEPSLETRHGSF